MDLREALPFLLPKAVKWAEENLELIASSGQALDEMQISLARKVGVSQPERIRIAFVNELPLPHDPLLRQAALETGLLGPHMAGLTLGHSIYICHQHYSAQLFSHECRHVFQYEQSGSIENFLISYLQQIVEVGYDLSPYEKDARAHEIDE